MVLFFNISIYGCKEKPASKTENFVGSGIIRTEEIEKTEDNIKQTNRTFYVFPHNGLNLCTEPSFNSTRIRGVQQYTRLNAHAVTNEKETIDGISDYWYKVDTGTETGWVFGGYLISNAPNNSNFILEKPVMENGIFMFSDGQTRNINSNSSGDFFLNHIKIYEKTSRESNYFELNGQHNRRVYFFKLDGYEDWLYLFDDKREISGFIFLYDILEEVSYENEAHSFLQEEYKISKKHRNIKRFGPVLIINYNNNSIRFGDSFSGGQNVSYNDFLIGYYPEHDEAVISTGAMEHFKKSIFNLKLNEYICKDIGEPFFNPSINSFISIYPGLDAGYGPHRLLRVYSRRNNYFENIFELELKIDWSEYNLYEAINVNVLWTNDNEAKIDFDKNNIFMVRINGRVEIYN